MSGENLMSSSCHEDQPSMPIPRKHSLSSLQQPSMAARDAALSSPRNRVGFTPSFDGVLNTGDSWVARRRASETSLKATGTSKDQGDQFDVKASEIREEEEEGGHQSQSVEHVGEKRDSSKTHGAPSQPSNNASGPDVHTVAADMAGLSLGANGSPVNESVDGLTNSGAPPGIPDLASVEWSYKDPSGQVQGIHQLLSDGKLCFFYLTYRSIPG